MTVSPAAAAATSADDDQWVIELWAVGAEQCEGVAKSVVRLREQGDRVKRVEFFIKAKSVVVVSERGECFIVSCERGLEEKI